MKTKELATLVAAVVILVACGSRVFVPMRPELMPDSGHASKFQLFRFGELVPVAMAPGPNGELWFSACREAAAGPCRVGFFDRSLHQRWVAHKFDFVNDLTLGPDGNMWYDQGLVYSYYGPTYFGKITRSLKVIKYRAHGWERTIVGGPDKRVWFDYNGTLASISTNGGAIKLTPYGVMDSGRAGPVIFVGPDKRLYFQRRVETRLDYPACAFAVFGKKLQCFRNPGRSYGAVPLLIAGRMLLAQNIISYRVYGLSLSGQRIYFKGGHAYYPLAFTNNQKLAVESLDHNNPNTGITFTQLSKDAILPGTYYALSPRQIQCQSYDFDRAVTTTNGYVWLHSGFFGPCLTRFSIRQ